MKYTNISDRNLNLATGACKPGDSAELTSAEVKLLKPQKLIEVYVEKPKSVKTKPKAKSIKSNKDG